MRPDASENSQISPSTIVWAARAAGSHPHLASVLLQGRKSANIHANSGVIRGIPVKFDASIFGGELPVGLGVVGIAVVLPGGDFVDEDLFVGNAAIEALGR